MLHCAHCGFHMWLGQNLLFKMAAFTVKCFTHLDKTIWEQLHVAPCLESQNAVESSYLYQPFDGGFQS